MNGDGTRLIAEKATQGRGSGIAARKTEQAEAVALAKKSRKKRTGAKAAAMALALRSQKQRGADSDNPPGPTSQYYMDPALIRWFTDNLPHRRQGARSGTRIRRPPANRRRPTR